MFRYSRLSLQLQSASVHMPQVCGDGAFRVRDMEWLILAPSRWELETRTSLAIQHFHHLSEKVF